MGNLTAWILTMSPPSPTSLDECFLMLLMDIAAMLSNYARFLTNALRNSSRRLPHGLPQHRFERLAALHVPTTEFHIIQRLLLAALRAPPRKCIQKPTLTKTGLVLVNAVCQAFLSVRVQSRDAV